MKKLLLRIVLIIYPIIAIGLYFGLLQPKYARLHRLEAELEGVRESELAHISKRRAEEIYEKQREQMREILAAFGAKTAGFDRASVPVFIGEVASRDNVAIVELVLRETFQLEGSEFLWTEITIRGGFVELLTFLRDLEEHGVRYVYVDSLSIAPGRGTDLHELKAGINILLSSPAERLVADAPARAEPAPGF